MFIIVVSASFSLISQHFGEGSNVCLMNPWITRQQTAEKIIFFHSDERSGQFCQQTPLLQTVQPQINHLYVLLLSEIV